MNRNTAAKSAVSIFYEDYNDIDIYIEDTTHGYKKIYKEIINRALKNFKIEQVFPLGNRQSVIEECEKNQEKNGRKKIYIVDGDYHLLNNSSNPELKGLYILPRYCLENFFIDEAAIVETANEEDHTNDYLSIQKILEFNSWVSHNQHLINLFIIYSIIFKYIPEEKTIGYKVTNFCNDSSGIVSETKILEKIKELKQKIKDKIGEDQLIMEIETRNNIVSKHPNALVKFISGKDYLLPLMKARLKSLIKFNPSEISLKNRLSKRCDIKELDNIENFIID